MKIALVADLHGNMTAVSRLEKDLNRRQPDKIWCLGDLVGKGPSSHHTFDWAAKNCDCIIKGNWDEGVGNKQFNNDVFYHEQLGPRRLEMLRNYPTEKSILLSGRRIRLMHGRPVMSALQFIHDDECLWAPFFLPDWDVVGYADCHRQGLRTLDCGLVFNTGSVGNSLGLTNIQYVIMEGEENDPSAPLDFTLVNLPYDREAAAEETRLQTGLRHPEAFIEEIMTGKYSRHLKGGLI